MSERKRVLILILILASSSIIVAVVAITVLYRTALKENQSRLVETAQSQARLIEAVARFNKKYSINYPGGPLAATLSQIIDAHRHYDGFGNTGEFTLSKKENENIVFLLSHRHFDYNLPRQVPFQSDLAEPMRRALLGQSGTVVGLDYRGEVVMAAHEPVAELDLGIVAKIDLSEIREPFAKAGIVTGLFSILVVFGGVVLFFRISNPIIKLLEDQNTGLELTNKKLIREIDERRQAEKALHKSEKRFRAIFEQAAVGVAQIKTMTGNFIQINQRYCDIVGYSQKEMRATTFMKITHPDDLQADLDNMGRLKSGTIHEFKMEKRYFHKNGSIIWVELTVSPMWNIGEEPNHHISVVVDITDRKRAEGALRESEENYRLLFDQMLNGFALHEIILDQSGTPIDSRFLDVNPAFQQIIGLKKSLIIGKTVMEVWPKTEPYWIEVFGNVAISGNPIQFENYHEQLDKHFFVSVFRSKKKQVAVNFIDINDRKRAEEELNKLNLELENRVKQRTAQLQKEVIERKQAEEMLRNNKEMLQLVFDGISDPLIMLSKNMEIRLLNKAACIYYHVEQNEVIGKPCYQAFGGLSAKWENCEVRTAVINHQDLVLEREGFIDSNRIEQVFVYPIEYKNKEEGAAIIRISDVTNEKMLQRQIVQSEKLSALGFLVSGVAHEINNPNNFISFNIPILREYLNEIILIIDNYAKEHENFELFGMTYPEFRKDVFKLLDNVENGSRRINIAVSNLREVLRTKEKTKIECVDVKVLVEKSVSICRNKINRMVKSFEVVIPEDLPVIFTDPETIETVVMNLLINAAQAVDKEDSWIRLNVTLDDSSENDLIIEVKDNGCGLDGKIKSHIFNPFFTTKSSGEGTGLGLTLCYNSIEKCGGRIDVDSVPGEGSTFKVTLPNNDTKNRNNTA